MPTYKVIGRESSSSSMASSHESLYLRNRALMKGSGWSFTLPYWRPNMGILIGVSNVFEKMLLRKINGILATLTEKSNVKKKKSISPPVHFLASGEHEIVIYWKMILEVRFFKED